MLPEGFSSRMKEILKEDYEVFASALEGENVRAFRLNPLKCQRIPEELSHFCPTPISYYEYGYRYTGDGIGNTATHHAGGIYCQDPGAMSALAAVKVERGWRVLDACSAPGGKSTQAAAMIGDEGFLLANEFVPQRAKITVSNFERLGLRSAMVTSLDTAVLGDLFSAYFDLVICDAPCSGEGMFRKYDVALTEWSEENIALCAKRQESILNNLADTVKDGGYLLYSTCTYAPEENEEQVAHFLYHHPDFHLVELTQTVRNVTAGGLVTPKIQQHLPDTISPKEIEKCRRFYPHIEDGEGQFIALLRRENAGNMQRILYKDSSLALTKEETRIVQEFLSATDLSVSDLHLRRVGERIVCVPHGMPVPPRSVFCAGVVLGEIRKGILFPHHQFFSAYGEHFLRRLNLDSSDTRTDAYLRGEELSVDLDAGWCAVLYEDMPLGGGKVSGGRMKNHYPKGLRKSVS